MLFSSWSSIVRVLVVGAPIYIALLAILRIIGKHALAKSNAYGLVVTTALGSTLASAVLTKQVTLIDGVIAIALLLGLQYLLGTLVTKYGWASRWFTAKPSLIVWEGKILFSSAAVSLPPTGRCRELSAQLRAGSSAPRVARPTGCNRPVRTPPRRALELSCWTQAERSLSAPI